MPGTVAANCYRPDLAGEKIIITLTRAAAYTARIAALTAAAPVLAGAAASAATAKLAGWELRQLASSPLSAEAGRLRVEFRELAAANATTPAQQQGPAGDGRDRHRPARTLVRSGKAHAELAAVNSAR